MTQPILSTPGAAAATVPHDPPPHRCGRCANPHNVYTPGRCPNDPVTAQIAARALLIARAQFALRKVGL